MKCVWERCGEGELGVQKYFRKNDLVVGEGVFIDST